MGLGWILGAGVGKVHVEIVLYQGIKWEDIFSGNVLLIHFFF